MKNEKKKADEASDLVTESPREASEPTVEESDGDAREFKVTIRKLDAPVRPRGVLAE